MVMPQEVKWFSKSGLLIVVQLFTTMVKLLVWLSLLLDQFEFRISIGWVSVEIILLLNSHIMQDPILGCQNTLMEFIV